MRRRLAALQLAAFSASAARGLGATSIVELEARASRLRSALALPPHDEAALAFDSSFTRADGTQRGWCNWLVPGRLMVGRYPHVDPISAPSRAGSPSFVGGPSEPECVQHLERLVRAGVDTYVCLQAELPPQDKTSAWPSDGRVHLSGAAGARFPAPFVRYHAAAVDANARLRPAARRPDFVHFPIPDLSVPAREEELRGLLDGLLERVEREDARLYVHCWGGRGRAGLVGAALLALLRPELDARAVLRCTQAAYDTRAGARGMKGSLARSPQTDEQREWVAHFVEQLSAAREELSSGDDEQA